MRSDDEADDEPGGEADDESAEVRYGTRWGVLGLVLVPALAIVAGLATAMATGVLAVSFVAQSGTVGLTTDGLRGDDLGIVVVSVPSKDAQGRPVTSYNARIGVGAGHINGLCISQHVSILGQPFTLLIKGGDADPSSYEVTADGLILDVIQAKGVIGASGDLQVNKNGADVSLGTSGIALGGASNRFGLQASNAQLKDIVATVHDISIPNLLEVPNFRIQVTAGSQDCPLPGSGTGSGP